MKVIFEADKEAEGVSYPYWLIVDPWQNMGCTIEGVTDKIAGPFFSRHAAERYFEKYRFKFSNRAQVACLSGEESLQYKNSFREE